LIEDWDDAYANGAYIEAAADYPVKWARTAAEFRQCGPAGISQNPL